jgi:hypothetical protein
LIMTKQWHVHITDLSTGHDYVTQLLSFKTKEEAIQYCENMEGLYGTAALIKGEIIRHFSAPRKSFKITIQGDEEVTAESERGENKWKWT